MILLEMGRRDQAYYTKWTCLENAGKETNKKQIDSLINLKRKLNEINLDILEKIVKDYGWPKKSKTGNASGCAFFVIQHQDDVAIQKKYLPYLEKVLKEKEIWPDEYAGLVDRILLKEGFKQKYGTQSQFNPQTNSFELAPVESIEEVNKNRKIIGMDLLNY